MNLDNKEIEALTIEEKNKLEWVTINDDLLDNSKFGGNYNIPHIIRQIKVYLIVMLFALLHEITHLLVGIILKFRPKQIEMMPFGFWIDLEPKEEDYKRKIIKSNITELKNCLA